MEDIKKLLFQKNRSYKIFIILIIVNTIINEECDRTEPILLKNGSCVLQFCTKEQFKNEECIINNQIIKTQLITNIIWVGEDDFRYINFANYSNGDMILETSSCPGNSKRIFYGLRKNGEYFFEKDGQITPFYSINVREQLNNTNNARYESENFIIKLKEEGIQKEYLVSMGKLSQYCELYDFDLNDINQKKSSEILGNPMISSREVAKNLLIGNDNYIIFCSWLISSDKYIFNVKKLKFDSNKLETGIIMKKEFNYEIENSNSITYSTSCFITNTNYIICMMTYRESITTTNFLKITTTTYNPKFIIYAFDKELNKLKEKSYDLKDFYQSSFSKCIYLRGNLGVFAYYDLNKDNNIVFPYIYEILYNSTSGQIINYITDPIEINYNNKAFNKNQLLNDIVRISINKACFSTTSEDKETLYIILVYSKEKKFILRFYSIEIFRLYNYKFLLDIREHLYNNYIAFGFSFCQQSTCNDDKEDPHNSAFLIFGYPNSSDVSYNLTEILYENNININNFEIDLKKNVKIENNIFGYIFSKIQIIESNNCQNISLLSKKNNNIINPIYNLTEDENIILKFENDKLYPINCLLRFRYIITEPEYIKFDKYPSKKSVASGSDSSSFFKGTMDEYIGRTSFCNIFLENNNLIFENTDKKEKEIKEKEEEKEIIKGEEEKEEKEIIKYEEDNKTIEKEIIKYEEEDSKTIEKEEEKENIKIEEDNKTIEKEEENEKKEKNSYENQEILEGNYIDKMMENDQIKDIYNQYKGNILTGEYNGEDTIIQTKNVLIQISTLESQKNCINPNISTIDLGECENILKKEYNISENEPLVIYKIDIKNDDLSSTYVQYEVYNPINNKQLELKYCDGVKIVINVPVNLDEETISLYESLSKEGYNLFDCNDNFYNDICSTYTSENGTDMTLEDRKNEMFYANSDITLCQSGCAFQSYNITTKKSQCSCDAQKEETKTDITTINFDKDKIAESFLNTLKNSNFLVLKCYKLAFDLNTLLKNKGRIILTIILFFFIILLLIYIIKDRKSISLHIKSILKIKMNFSKNKDNNLKAKLNGEKETKNGKDINNKNKGKRQLKKPYKIKSKNRNKNNKGNIVSNNKSNKSKKTNNNKNNKKSNNKNNNKTNNNKNNNKSKTNKNKKGNSKFEPTKKKINQTKNNSKQNIENTRNNKTKSNRLNSLYQNSNECLTNQYQNNKTLRNININIVPITNINYAKAKNNKNLKNIKEDNIIIYSNKEKNIGKDFKYIDYKNLNDQELNTLEYEIALIYDKRTYFQYYWSLLKKKHLILFTFIPTNDYNLLTLKISLFLLSFSLYFTINGFFFSDETMHKIHEDNGAFDIIYQIPQILYSSIVSAIINMILKLLSLSEKNILTLKQQNNINKCIKYSKAMQRYVIIKFSLFFLLSISLLLFFWYFISCFCGVYTNTQNILIKDTLYSFALSMIYPIGLSLLPGFFRIPALRNKRGNKKCLYKFSGLIALI